MANSIKTIIFDIGGVVTRTDFQAIYFGFAQRIGIAPEIVIDYHDSHFEDLLLGNMTLKQFWNDMKSAGGNSDLDYKRIWVEEGVKNRKINTDLLDCIGKLRKHYRVGTLTNLTPSRELIDREMDLYSNFDYMVLSCDEHLKKPDPTFYLRALEAASAKPEGAIFIDDQEKYVVAVGNVGIKGIRYTYPDNASLIGEFKKLGVIVD
jgi:HAD superfamily hydrolase (TIGR01509 family)